MEFIRKNVDKILLMAYTVFAPVFYADAACDPTKQICNPISQNTIMGFIQTLLKGVLNIGIPVVALAIVYCGFLFVQARGKPEAITKAKSALLYTLIGAAILLGSWAIAELISNTVLSL